MFKILLKLKPRDRFFKCISLKQQNWCDFWGFVIVFLKTQFMDNTQGLGKCYYHYTYLDHDFAYIAKNFPIGSNDVCLIVFWQQLSCRMPVSTKKKMENETGKFHPSIEALITYSPQPAPLVNDRSINISTDYVVLVIVIWRQIVN